jgi:hypothetical protein
VNDHEEFTIRIRALPDPDGVPAANRVRRWLKVGLQAFRLRSLGFVGGVPGKTPGVPSDAARAEKAKTRTDPFPAPQEPCHDRHNLRPPPACHRP